MKNILFLALVALFTGCHSGGNESAEMTGVKIDSAEDNACIKCTEKIRFELATCLQKAGSNENERSKCNLASSNAWVAQCKALCNPRVASFQDETPRMKCLREAAEANIKCLSTAMTPAQKTKCNKDLTAAIAACPPPDPTPPDPARH